MKSKLYKALSAIAIVSALTLTGCDNIANNSQANENVLDVATREMRQNDYRGGLMRTGALQTNILSVMEEMKANNVIIRQDSPNSFWTTDGYQDFVSTFLDTAIINDTQWFNEEETDWATIISQIASTQNSFSDTSSDSPTIKSGISIVRNEKDDYSVSGVDFYYLTIIDNLNYSFNGKANYRILYDCDKDWCKAYVELNHSDSNLKGYPPYTVELFEYRRIDDNTFAIQTSRERLMVVLEPVTADTDIRERKVKEFYYSKLVINGQRTTFKTFTRLPEVDNNGVKNSKNESLNALVASNPYLNLQGDLYNRYGVNDSVFYVTDEKLTRDWVYEDKALQQGIVYKDGILVVTTYNKLSSNYERFIYSRSGADTSMLSELENLVQIDNLVGVQSVEIKDNPSNNSGDTTPSGSDGSDSNTGNEESSSETSETSDSNSESVDSDTEDSNSQSTSESIGR